MPAATPGRRLPMEEALGPELVRAILELCRLAGVRSDRWHLVVAIARPFELAAVCRLAEEIRAVDGGSMKDSRQAAALRLGLNPDTSESRLRRWPLDAYDQAA